MTKTNDWSAVEKSGPVWFSGEYEEEHMHVMKSSHSKSLSSRCHQIRNSLWAKNIIIIIFPYAHPQGTWNELPSIHWGLGLRDAQLSSNSALTSIAQTIWVQIPPFTCQVTLDKSASLCFIFFVKWGICAHLYLMHIKQFLAHNNKQEMNVGQVKLSNPHNTPHSQRHILGN